jgi:hypothetical protein
VPLAELRAFVREVDDFSRADGEAGPKALEVAIVHGSLAIETEPTAHPALLPILSRAITVSAETDFHADDADQWVKVERYVRGEIVDMGGYKQVNAHIRLPDGKELIVEADREFLDAAAWLDALRGNAD